MRFGLVHRVLLSALAALGTLALVTSGNLGRWVNVAIVVGLVFAIAIPEAWRTKLVVRHVASFGPVGMLALQVVRIIAFDAPILETAVEFAAALQIVRLATRQGGAHDQQVIILALLHLIAGTMLGGGISYGLCFLGFLVVVPGALMLSHLRREVEGNYRQGARDRAGLPVDVPRILRSRRVVGKKLLLGMCLLSVPILAFTALLFVAFPRVGLSLLLFDQNKSGRMIGFSDRINLGEVGALQSDPTLALRVEVQDLADPPPSRIEFHLRGTAFDLYDGQGWSRSPSEIEPVDSHYGFVRIRRRPKPGRDRMLTIDLEPIEPPLLFIPHRAVALRMRDPKGSTSSPKVDLFAGSDGEFRYRTGERGLRYEVFLGGENERSLEALSEDEMARYLSLPPTLSTRIEELTRSIVGNRRGAWEKANEIQEYLREHFRYDLSSPSGGAADPLDDFLFRTRAGHCEFYSTAMVVMLRQVGVPARNVTGFLGGTYNRFGNFYAVRQGDAHSWVEAFVDGLGWMTFDPTPAMDRIPQTKLPGVLATLRDLFEATSRRWDRHVVGYDLHQQVSTFQRLRRVGRGSTKPSIAQSPKLRAIGSIVAGALLLGGIGWYLYRRQRTQGGPGKEARPVDPRTQAAISLYGSLEQAMAAQGVPRRAGTPPLRHAEALEATGHPLAQEIVALTRIYQAARFGGENLSVEARRDYQRRVKRLKSARLERRA